MSLINERELKGLLADSKLNLTDQDGSDDYAFLEETVLPTLLPSLAQLLERVEQKEQHAAENTPPFNPIRWLAESLMRHHPEGGAFEHRHAYGAALARIAEQRKEARLGREKTREEEKRKAEEAEVLKQKEQVAEQERARAEKAEARRKAAAALEEEKRKAGELAVEKAMKGDDRVDMVLEFRAKMVEFLEKEVDFRKEDDTSRVNTHLHKMSCELVVSHTAASFASAADLVGEEEEQILFVHTAADKKEAVVEEEEEAPEDDGLGEEFSKAPKIPPPPRDIYTVPPPLVRRHRLRAEEGAGGVLAGRR
mmetsp:Transcript_5368/g.12424  ORF Transcript_5368/g.12424 Transcript_5368/m.12424 type:complete len:309 (+) Transcript_5368:202-1128(+)